MLGKRRRHGDDRDPPTGGLEEAGLPRLRYLHLSNARITDRGLAVLGALEAIDGLSLQGNAFTDEGLAALKSATQLKQLILGLGESEITDAGLVHLRGLANLEVLGLQRTGVTDEGLIHLRGLKNLKTLWVSNTQVTEEGKAKLSGNFTDKDGRHLTGAMYLKVMRK